MSDSIKDRIATDFQKVKTQGSVRASRIGEIVRDAASQAMTELKAGSSEIGTIAKDTFSTISEDAKETGQEFAEDSTRSQPVSLFTTLKNRLVVELKNQLTTLDTTLAARYGDRYQTVKQKIETLAARYRSTIANAETQNSDPLQQKQAEFETKAGAAGAAAARKESQIKQQLKDFLQTAAAKI